MKQVLCISAILFFSWQASGRSIETTLVLANDTLQNNLSASDIQGAWKCIHVIESYPAEIDEEKVLTNMAILDLPTIVFEGDSMWTFDYPCLLLHADTFSIKSNIIKTRNAFDRTRIYQVALIKDTLILTHANIKGPVIRRYVRDTVSASVVRVLKKDTMNTDCLLGTWQYVPPGDGHGEAPSKLVYPFKPNALLVITRKDISPSALENKKMFLFIDGKKREFRFDLKLAWYQRQLRLEPVIHPKGWPKDSHMIIIYKK
ncbi:MAG: hypothetical protein FD123_4294 [Bacteroidetes bacterium]|nr:MAG: hypothetical protein FD123_4294 [Bacteroidota bacterium]